MTDARSSSVPKPDSRSRRWTSFVGADARGRAVRGLNEEGNPQHRVRVEHNKHTLLVHISDEDGRGWTTLAIDRKSRQWAIAQRTRQLDAATVACDLLYV
jgi:hypothetical protein